jgi:hypothetical protein
MLKIKELKGFLNTLPLEFDEFTIANGEYGMVDKEKEFYYRLDKSIVALHVDEEHKEMIFLHQTDEEVETIQGDVAKKDENGDKE